MYNRQAAKKQYSYLIASAKVTNSPQWLQDQVQTVATGDPSTNFSEHIKQNVLSHEVKFEVVNWWCARRGTRANFNQTQQRTCEVARDRTHHLII